VLENRRFGKLILHYAFVGRALIRGAERLTVLRPGLSRSFCVRVYDYFKIHRLEKCSVPEFSSVPGPKI